MIIKEQQQTSLTLEELTAKVGVLLARYGLIGAQQDRRVSAAPDARTIRYYTTLGLLDRPSLDGKQARYGRRHLLQLLAIKALQGISMPLGEIQARLYGRSDSELEAILEALFEKLKRKREDGGKSGIRPVCWREVIIEPGLKIMAEEAWTPALDEAALEERIRAAINALKTARGGQW